MSVIIEEPPAAENPTTVENVSTPPSFTHAEHFVATFESRRIATLEKLRKQIEYEVLKAKVQFEKIEKTFCDPIISEKFSLDGICKEVKCDSLEVRKLPLWMQKELNKLHEESSADSSAKSHLPEELDTLPLEEKSDPGSGKKSSARRKSKHKNAQKERKEKRYALMAKRKETVAQKPDEAVDDFADLAAISEAEATIGDYKLKNNADKDPNFFVPLDRRWNANQKGRQLVLLRESANNLRISLNDKLKVMLNERSKIKENDKEHIEKFDASVDWAYGERCQINVDLTTMHLHELTIKRELEVLNAFEAREVELTQQLLKYRTEKAGVVVDLAACHNKLENELAGIKEWQKKDQDLTKEFEKMVQAEKHPYYDALKKIFKKKIKRRKKSNNDGDDDESSDDETSDSSDDESTEEEECCPKDCKQQLYDQVLELRERRLDMEDALEDIKKNVLSLKSEFNSLQTREKNIDKSLEATETEIQQFHTEKQKTLNKIIVYVPLFKSQITCDSVRQLIKGDSLEDELRLSEKDPTRVVDLTATDDTVIFSTSVMERLKKRIDELFAEKAALAVGLQDMKKLDRRLRGKIRGMQTQIDIERKRCEEVQVLKFGELTSLEDLDHAAENEETEQLRLKLAKTENVVLGELFKLSKENKKAEDELHKIVLLNTKLNQDKATLMARRMKLTVKMDKLCYTVQRQQSHGQGKGNSQHVQQLADLARKQDGQIENMKGELYLLRSKGGGHLVNNENI